MTVRSEPGSARPQHERVGDWLSHAIVGDSTDVAAQLDDLITITGAADEFMGTTSTHADADRDGADPALAAVMEIPAPNPH